MHLAIWKWWIYLWLLYALNEKNEKTKEWNEGLPNVFDLSLKFEAYSLI